MKHEMILGIDIAKTKFDACLCLASGQQRQKTFANHPTGFTQLHAWLQEHQVGALRVGIEATGPYWMSLAHDLYSHGLTVCLLNPAYVRDHVRSCGCRSKTDRVDARMIADYVATHDCQAWAPLPAELEELRELMRLYGDLVGITVSLRQRREGLRTVPARMLQAQIAATLKEFTRKVLKAAQAHTRRHSTLKQPVECLRTIKGIGPVTALVLTAELPRGRAARTIAGWAGVTPRHFVSGKTIHKKPKLCKQGNDHVRHSLYWPAITALRCNPAMQPFARRLQQAGLNKMQIIGAAMHKLLRWSVAVMESQKPFNPSLHATAS